MNVLSSYIVVLMVLTMGTAVHAVDTAIGAAKVLVDNKQQFLASGYLS